MKSIDAMIDSMSLDEQIGQLLCVNLSNQINQEKYDEIEAMAKRIRLGSYFFQRIPSDRIRKVSAILDKYSAAPTIVAADIENGIGSRVTGTTEESLPFPMAWGAADAPELVEAAHSAVAERCRQLGIHWSFSPVVDINYNYLNSVVNVRAISDKPEQVIKIGGAAIRGMQKNGFMVTTAKHFPGDGVDSRNQHLSPSVNTLSKEEWMETYGKVYKEMIQQGTGAIMIGHIALPAFDEKLNDWLGYPPATISYNLITKLLKQELGFEGCVVSDAMPMVGVCAAVHPDRLAIEFIKAGGDMVLFALPEYFDQLKEAVLSGEISRERIRDAVSRVLRMKQKARLFEQEEEVLKDLTERYDLPALSNQIAEKSITLIRNFADDVPLSLKPGDRVLLLNIQKDGSPNTLTVLEEEFKKRGIEAISFINPDRENIEPYMAGSAAVLLNLRISCKDYMAGTLGISWEHIRTLWRGMVLRHPKCIFTSFGDPYKLYDYSYAKTYINAYSSTESTQRAFVKALLGEIPFERKSRVGFKGLFETEV